MYTAKCLCALAFLALHHGHFWHYIIVCPNLHSINAFGFVHCSSLLSLALAKFHNVHPSAPIPIMQCASMCKVYVYLHGQQVFLQEGQHP